jgi:hypothetical protein
MYCSTVLHGLSDQTPFLLIRQHLTGYSRSRPLRVDQTGSPSGTLPRNLSSTTPAYTDAVRPATTAGTSAHYGRPSQTPPPAGSQHIVQSTPSTGLVMHERPEFVQLEHTIFRRWWDERVVQGGEFLSPFLIHVVTVWRLTPKVRVSPRRLERSW